MAAPFRHENTGWSIRSGSIRVLFMHGRLIIPAVSLALITMLGVPRPLQASSSALIVTGLSGSSQNTEEFARLAAETKRLLAERGIPADQIGVLGGKVDRETVLQKLRAAAAGSADDDFWLVLFGHGGKARGGAPAFQISGPRLTAGDLKSALDAIPARQYVFIGTGASGAFLPLLQNSRRVVLSATKEDGESDLPRLPAEWVNAFSENPKAAFPRIAARAAELVGEKYKNENLAQGEHARLADPVTGTILAPPFGVDLLAEKESPSGAPSSARLISPSEIKIEIRKPNAEWERQPATEETKAIVDAARRTPNPDGHAAIVLEQRLGFTIEEDRTTDRLTFRRVFIVGNEAVEEWANHFFPQSPPMLTTRLEVARVIQPDGSAIVFNPAKLPACTDPQGGCGATSMVYLPGAKAGCVIEIGYRTRAMLNATLPHVSETIPLLLAAPVLKTSLEIRVPEKPAHRVVLNNISAPARESSGNGRHVYRWDLDALPAAEPLPGDPPWPLWAAHAAVSSLPSWKEFADWYRRLAKGSDDIDDTVKKMAAQLADGATSRVDKIRRDFEFVSALRYVAIEIGVQGFRPRTPSEVLANRYGDCKDKANLLVALMRCQGIDANFVLLNRGAATDVSFPSWQFNHAIAFVAKAPDAGQPEDLWLDATDSVTPFGFVPPGDYGRDGLVLGKDTADFRKVAGPATMSSEVRNEWDLVQEGRGWKGGFHRVATGIAEDGLRRVFRGLTPEQRKSLLYQMLAELWPAGDFDRASIRNVGELGASVELRAEATAPPGELPHPGAPGLENFNPPTRNRPLWLNDGQPLTLLQTVRLHYKDGAPETLPPPLQTEVAGEKFLVVWERNDPGTLTRTARLELAQPIVKEFDYADMRRAIRNWNASLRDERLSFR
ncbi:MAG: transglutaminase domain-containing protein [Terrimicrobiaceae bacterium]